jgi:hypothetical protein
MLAYHISQSNGFTFRTEPTSSNAFTMSLQDMYTLQNLSASMSGLTYEGYESILAFTASITGAIVGGEYRAVVYNGDLGNPIWHGTIQVYASQSLDKAVYENQNTQYVSHPTENRYVILD